MQGGISTIWNNIDYTLCKPCACGNLSFNNFELLRADCVVTSIKMLLICHIYYFSQGQMS